MTELPTGTVTFLFTDIEGSTRLLQELGEGYRRVQDEHATILRRAIADGGGVEIRTEGDAFFAVFPSPTGAVRAAVAAQRTLAGHDWSHGRPLRVRMGMHTGEGVLGGDDYLGIDVNRAARIAAAGHGGQVLVSEATRALVQHHLPSGVGIRDLGPHRLKDLAHAERLSQLDVGELPASFPPLRSLETPTNLPTDASSFVGRAAETERIQGLIEEHRLVTLTGPGGSGKTRLALHVAGGVLDRFPDGVFFVPMASTAEPSLVCPTICRVLGLRDEGIRGAEETLEHHLRDRRALLVLDNFEHLLDAAGFVGGLVRACPRVHLLITSRAVLRVSGERDVPVPPLPLGDPGDPAGSEAVALFVDRARGADPAFELTEESAPLVAEICARLDGLPLAIEMAASRVRLLPPEALLVRLDRSLAVLTTGARDLPDRQRTLRGTISWSYDLLEPAERSVFRRLAVFAGGWTMEAAEGIAGDGDPLSALGSLVDHSLVRAHPDRGPRYDMLETIREFALERLEAEGEREATERRLAGRCLELAESAEPHYRGMDAVAWLGRIEAEHDNLQAALRWAVGADEGEVAMRLLAALWRYWHVHGHLTAGRRWAEAVLALPSAGGRSALRGRALTAAGGLAYWQFEVPEVRGRYEEALSNFEEAGDPAGVAEATYNLGFASGLEGDLAGARNTFERARELFDRAGVRRGVADTSWILGLLARLEGDLPRSREMAEESLRMHEEMGDAFGMVDALEVAGRAAFEMGDLATARAHTHRVLDIVEPFGNRTGLAIALDNMAAHALAEGRPDRAVQLGGASAAIKEAAGGAAPPQLVDLPDPRIAAREKLVEDEIRALWEAGRAMSLDDALAFARADRPEEGG